MSQRHNIIRPEKPQPHPMPSIQEGNKCPFCRGISLGGGICEKCRKKNGPPGRGGNGPLMPM